MGSNHEQMLEDSAESDVMLNVIKSHVTSNVVVRVMLVTLLYASLFINRRSQSWWKQLPETATLKPILVETMKSYQTLTLVLKIQISIFHNQKLPNGLC
jgi:hypothetical protein